MVFKYNLIFMYVCIVDGDFIFHQVYEGSTLSLFSTQDLGLECNNEFQDLGPELNIAFRT